MTNLVALAATVHTPYITAWPDRAPVVDREQTLAGFRTIGERFAAADVDTIVMLTSEHIVALSPRMAPAFTVGVGEEHPVFPEPHFGLSMQRVGGNRSLALHILNELFDAGFDPAHSVDLTLDHGTVLPLALMGIAPATKIVPIVINSLFHPLPRLQRCRELGAELARIVDALPAQRIGMIATGGVSHTVGKPHPERNDPQFDHIFVSALQRGAIDEACAFSDERIEAAGNGTHEIRNWIAVAAAAQGRAPKVITAIPFAPGWDSGVFQLLWPAA